MITKVAIIERIVCGISGFRAECMDCPWKGTPRSKEATAVADAKTHVHKEAAG